MSRAVGTIQAFGFGLVFAAAAILAACGGGSGDVTGPPGGAGPVDSLVLNLDSAEVIVGDTVRLTAQARDANGQVVPGVRLSYTSSDPAVATVSDEGLVTAVDLGVVEIEVGIAGEAGIRAASLAPSSSAVMASPRTGWHAVIVPKVVITPGEQTLDPGATSQYSARLTNIRGAELQGRRQWTWRSSDPSVASIDASGLATTLKEGDTRITVEVLVGRQFWDKANVPLHVVLCNGIFKVPSWLAGVDVVYQASGHIPPAQTTYIVDQFSGAAATLVKVPDQSGADSMVWEGKLSNGEVGLNNSVTFPVPPPVSTAVTKEVKTGVVQDGPTAFARLSVKKPSPGSRVCTYNFQYGDYFTWTITNDQGAPPIPKAGPSGIARVIGKEVGAPRENGQWVLGGLEASDRIQLPARAFMDAQPRSDYTVGSTLGVSMIIALGGAAATYGQATFTHILGANSR